MNPRVSSFASASHARSCARRRPPTHAAAGRTSAQPAQQAGIRPPRQTTRYRATSPMMVLAFRDNHQNAVTIPAGEAFEVVGPAQDDRFIVVEVDGDEFLIFESDLRECGKPALG